MCVAMCLNSVEYNEGKSDIKQLKVWSYKCLVQFSTFANFSSPDWSERFQGPSRWRSHKVERPWVPYLNKKD